MDTMQVQAAISALYGSDVAEAARANTFLMEFTEQPVNTTGVPNSCVTNIRYIRISLGTDICLIFSTVSTSKVAPCLSVHV